VSGVPLLYDELASWWALLSPPEDYAAEAEVVRELLGGEGGQAPTLLELGSGGGSNAVHLARRFRATLVDLSPAMLAESRQRNPGCEHVHGDMRSVRLGREFDAVFVHDAVAYMRSEEDLRRAIETAAVHCRLGGTALFAPDFLRETFRPGTSHGEGEAEGRSLRWLEWTGDRDAADGHYEVDYAFLLREGDQPVRGVLDRHVLGLFERERWLRLLADAGFGVSTVLGARAREHGVTDVLFRCTKS
jgi:SAM-dependent methyltransferase